MVFYDSSILDDDGHPLFRSPNWDSSDQKHLDNMYKQYPYLFSIRIHHGGLFNGFPDREYIFGEETIVDILDSDKFSFCDLNFYVMKLGYKDEIMYYHFLKPDKDDLDYGLAPFGTDIDVRKLISYVEKYKMFEIYIEHARTNLGDYWKSTGESNVILEEIEDVPENVVVTKPKKPRTFTRLLLEGPTQESCENEPMFNLDDLDDGTNAQPEVNVEEKEQNVEDLNVDENVNDGPSVQADENGNDGPSVQADENMNDGPNVDENVNDGPSDAADEGPKEYFKDQMATDMVNDVEVDMSHVKDFFERDDEWLRKGVQEGVGNLEINEEVVGINFDLYDSGSDGEEGMTRDKKLKKMKNVSGVGNPGVICPFHLGKPFLCSKQVKSLVKSYAIQTRRELRFTRNEPKRIRVRCFGNVPYYKKSTNKEESLKEQEKLDKGKEVITEKATCPWHLFVSQTDQEKHLYVKTFIDTHTCSQKRKLRWANSTFLSEHIGDTISADPDISGKALQSQLQKNFQLGINKQVVYRAKHKAMNRLRGDFVEQYSSLKEYVLELKTRNPDTTVRVDVETPLNPDEPERIFKRIYICLGALKRGFKACGRDLLGLDGAFMKGPYPGQVLTAVGVDGNNGIYPLAYAIVEAENRSSWEWFLSCLGDDLDLEPNSNFTFISDRQKGIIPALANLFPCAEHRFCLRHIHENLKAFAKQGDLYKDLLWQTATCTTVPEFERSMLEIKKVNPRVHDWLKEIPSKHWARCHFSGRPKCEILLNNICESFNSKTVDARDKPIITCLEYIREYMMRRIVVVQQVIEKCKGPLTPTATMLFEEIKTEAHKYTVVWNGENLYQVKGPWQDQAVVDMVSKSCSCRRWELTGIPCKHTVATIWNMFDHGFPVGEAEDWVHSAYRLETWKEVYSFKINPTTGRSTWPINDSPYNLLPPHHHTQVGRPTKKRRRSAEEKLKKPMVQGGRLSRIGKTVTCSKCKQRGHNARKCKGQKEQSSTQPKRKKQRKSPQEQSQAGGSTSQAGGSTSQAGVAASQGQGTQASSSVVASKKSVGGSKKRVAASQGQGTQASSSVAASKKSVGGSKKRVAASQGQRTPPHGSQNSSQKMNKSPRLHVPRFSGTKSKI